VPEIVLADIQALIKGLGGTRVVSLRRASTAERQAYVAWLEDEFDDA
jgi:hypothetical protein